MDIFNITVKYLVPLHGTDRAVVLTPHNTYGKLTLGVNVCKTCLKALTQWGVSTAKVLCSLVLKFYDLKFYKWLIYFRRDVLVLNQAKIEE